MSSRACSPSTATIIYEHEKYLAFPAIARAGSRLLVLFSLRSGNPLDFSAQLLLTVSEDEGRSWSSPEVWMEQEGGDVRNCGGETLPDGRAHFVYDIHGGQGRWRRTFFRTTEDGHCWSPPVRLQADRPGQGSEQITSVGNRGVLWHDGQSLYFPHFFGCGHSVLVGPDGEQTRMPSVPRIEPTVAWNRHGELVAFSKGGPVDVSQDQGQTWQAVAQLQTISQPDLLQLQDGRLLFCYSDKNRLNEYLLLSEDGYDLEAKAPLRIFEGTGDGRIDSRGKAMSLEDGKEILTVLYEACGPRGPSRIFLVRTPKAALE